MILFDLSYITFGGSSKVYDSTTKAYILSIGGYNGNVTSNLGSVSETIQHHYPVIVGFTVDVFLIWKSTLGLAYISIFPKR